MHEVVSRIVPDTQPSASARETIQRETPADVPPHPIAGSAAVRATNGGSRRDAVEHAVHLLHRIRIRGAEQGPRTGGSRSTPPAIAQAKAYWYKHCLRRLQEVMIADVS